MYWDDIRRRIFTQLNRAIGVMHMFLYIVYAKYIDGYKVQVKFDNGREGIADLSDALKGTVFASLKDKSNFSKLKVDKELKTIVWPNGADMAPEYVFFQAFRNESGLQEQFKRWGYIA